jgi:hypothetical protein
VTPTGGRPPSSYEPSVTPTGGRPPSSYEPSVTPTGGPPPTPTETPVSRLTGPADPGASARLTAYNLVQDAAGTFVLLYGGGGVVTCDVGGPVMPYNPGGGGLPAGPAWSATVPASIDTGGAVAGGRASGKYPSQRGYESVAGRVRPDVARLVATNGRERLTVRPVNGTYLVRFVHSVDWAIPNPDSLPIRVVAYDAAGRSLGAAAYPGEICFGTSGQTGQSSTRASRVPCRPGTPR